MFDHKDLFLELTAFKATEALELTSRLSFTFKTIDLLSSLFFFLGRWSCYFLLHSVNISTRLTYSFLIHGSPVR